MATFINRIEDRAALAGIERNTKQSLEWFRKEIQNITMPSRPKLMADENLDYTNKPLVGRMFMYLYDPKHKKTLPYYDRFPLIFLIDRAEGGFYGLNLHYLSPRYRAIFFDNLTEYTNNEKYNKTTRLRLKYNFLASNAKLRYFLKGKIIIGQEYVLIQKFVYPTNPLRLPFRHLRQNLL